MKKTPSVDEIVKARREEIETAVRDMVDTVESYFYNSAFQFIEGSEAQPGEQCFPEYPPRFSMFESWVEKWMGALEPLTLELQENGDPSRELIYYGQRFACQLGVLIRFHRKSEKKEPWSN